MNLRTHRRRRIQLMSRAVSVHSYWVKCEIEQDGCRDFFDYDYDDDGYDDDGYDCTHCGGEGYCQVDDPLWDDCDEFGYGPCTYCDGTGDRANQTVF